MKSHKVRIGLVFVLVVLLFSTLTLLYWDFVRDTIIVPIYYLLWIGNLVLKSIPQETYLVVLILISVIIGGNTLDAVRIRPAARRLKSGQSQVTARYLHWKRLCAGQYASLFARDTFAWEARKLILAILADQDGIEIAEVETRVKNGSLPVPEPIRGLIEQRVIRGSPPPPHPIENAILRARRLFLRVDSQPDSHADGQIAEIVTFIENQLEFNNAGSQPQSYY